MCVAFPAPVSNWNQPSCRSSNLAQHAGDLFGLKTPKACQACSARAVMIRIVKTSSARNQLSTQLRYHMSHEFAPTVPANSNPKKRLQSVL